MIEIPIMKSNGVKNCALFPGNKAKYQEQIQIYGHKPKSNVRKSETQNVLRSSKYIEDSKKKKKN